MNLRTIAWESDVKKEIGRKWVESRWEEGRGKETGRKQGKKRVLERGLRRRGNGEKMGG